MVPIVCIDVASYVALGHVASGACAHVHRSGNFYSFLLIYLTLVRSGGLLVNTTHFPVPATDSQSLKLA